MQEQFEDLPDQIPYRKITSFNIIEVSHNNGVFKIRLNRKCQELTQENNYLIIRKIADFKWLLEKLEKQNPQVIVLPILAESGWLILETLSNKLAHPTKIQQRRKSNEYFECQRVQRFFKLLSEVTLQHIYRIPKMNQSSLFTFLDASFELYKLQSYQKTPRLLNSSGSSLSAFAQTIGKGSMKLLEMLYVTKQVQHKSLLKQKQMFEELQLEIKQFIEGVENIEKNLQILSGNFLGEQAHLKEKELQIYKIYLKLLGILKNVTLVINQITQIAIKCEQLEGKVEREILNKQIRGYSKFLEEQAQSIRKQFQAMMKQFYHHFFEQKVELKFNHIYPCKF